MWLLFEPCRSKRQRGRAHRKQETNFGGALLHKPGSLSLAFLVVAAVVFVVGAILVKRQEKRLIAKAELALPGPLRG